MPVRLSAEPRAAARHAAAAAHLARYYDDRLAAHGDTPAGAAWPNAHDRTARFDALLEIVADLAPGPQASICDLGCGTGELLARIRERGLHGIAYTGADVSAAALAHAHRKFPRTPFHRLDVLAASAAQLEALRCDVLVANGLFTVKAGLTRAEMWDFMAATLERVWPLVRRGVAFNVMSSAVDRERDDLFHVSYDELARFLHGLAGRAIGFRADYGLYEYMAYAAKEPRRETTSAPAAAPPPDADAPAGTIPAYRALLPRAAAIVPYLAELDGARRYSNHGGLVRRFESRLADLFGVTPPHVASASSGTAALAGAILGSAGRAGALRPYCLCPAYTFVGTASAIEQCGYRLHVADVDAGTWSLDPDALANHPLLAQTGLVAVVAPYGRMPAQERWAEFERRTGIPVVIDAAAGFEAIAADPGATVGPVPVSLSFHASKSFSTGEGGAVACSDVCRAAAIARALNFGFFGERVSHGPSINGKMSEYHAAVGLAELDGWDAKRAAFAAVAAAYARAADAAGLAGRIVTAPDVASCYALFAARDAAQAAAVRAALDADGIEHRSWYGRGLHREPAFVAAGCDALDRTDALAPRLIGLPVAPDLAEPAVRRVVRAIAAAARG